jgi:serine/threonine protein kinase
MLGEYRVGALLGVGGMGAVYEGIHPLIGKRVAVKVLLPQLSSDAELVKRFVAEARSVNEIRHRNIVDIFAFGQLPDGSHYFLMEYLEGEPFDLIIRNRGPLPVHEALYWCEEVLEALGAAHDFGIIHRDIKPSNVFMVQPRAGRRYIKLLDFGIAKLASGGAGMQTQASVVIGTPVYMSPEQARGRTIGPTTDIYAIGCMLFEMVTGRVLFPAENQNQVMFMHAEDAPPLAKSLNPLVPEALDELLQKLLKKDPLHRPQTAEDVRIMCELVRRQVNSEISFTQVANRPVTGEAFRSIAGRTPQPSPSQAMDAALLRNRATPSPTAPPPGKPADDDGFGATMVRLDSGVVPPVAVPPVAPSVVVPASVVVPSSVVLAAPKSRLPWVMGAVTVLALAFAGWKTLAPAPSGPELVAPPPVTVTPAEIPIPVVEAAPVVPPPPAPPVVAPPVVVAKMPAKSVKPVEVSPVGKEPNLKLRENIERRLGNLENRLKKKEAATGDADGVLRQFLQQARVDAKAADTDARRKAVLRNLDDIKAQLEGY